MEVTPEDSPLRKIYSVSREYSLSFSVASRRRALGTRPRRAPSLSSVVDPRTGLRVRAAAGGAGRRAVPVAALGADPGRRPAGGLGLCSEPVLGRVRYVSKAGVAGG